jgi:hypothetical protein
VIKIQESPSIEGGLSPEGLSDGEFFVRLRSYEKRGPLEVEVEILGTCSNDNRFIMVFLRGVLC